MKDLPLFLQTRPALARTKDKSTSHRGALWVQGAGRLGRQEKMVLEALANHPGTTARELARIMACADVNVPARRLSGLRERGIVRNGDKRVCSVSKMLAQTWYVGTLPAAKPSAVSRSKERDAGPILTAEQRRAIREQLATGGSEAQRRFLEGVADDEEVPL